MSRHRRQPLGCRMTRRIIPNQTRPGHWCARLEKRSARRRSRHHVGSLRNDPSDRLPSWSRCCYRWRRDGVELARIARGELDGLPLRTAHLPSHNCPRIRGDGPTASGRCRHHPSHRGRCLYRAAGCPGRRCWRRSALCVGSGRRHTGLRVGTRTREAAAQEVSRLLRNREGEGTSVPALPLRVQPSLIQS